MTPKVEIKQANQAAAANVVVRFGAWPNSLRSCAQIVIRDLYWEIIYSKSFTLYLDKLQPPVVPFQLCNLGKL